MGAVKNEVEISSHQILSGVITVFHFKPSLPGEVESPTPYEVAMMFNGKIQYIVGETKEEAIACMENLLMEALWYRCEEIFKKS